MKHYCLHCKTELEENQIICSKCFHCFFLDMLDDKVFVSASGVLSAQQIESNSQWMKYRCGLNGSTGHGYAAEDANAINDILKGREVEFSGRDYTKSGPDRIVDNVEIQTKYCRTAKLSVDAAFNPETGIYKYKSQVLEVPKDQYEDALREMGKKIKEGKVPEYTDPEDASKIVKNGDYTYKQALHFTKSGNIDSLILDTKVHTITAISAFGISFSIKLALLILYCRSMSEVKDAMKLSFLSGLQNGTITLSTGILTSQVLRTTLGRNFTTATQKIVNCSMDNVYQSQLGKKMINNLAKNILDKDLYGGAAKNAAKKYTKNFLRTNIATNLSLLVVTSLPDTYRVLSGCISKPQFAKNVVANGAGIATGTIGAFIGKICGGSPGCIVGGLLGGIGANILSKHITNKIHRDDAQQMCQLINVALIQLSNDYLIQTEEELSSTIRCIVNEHAIDDTFLRLMYNVGRETNNDWVRVELAYRKLNYYFYSIVRQRRSFKLLNNQKLLLQCLDELGNDINEN